MLEKMDDFFAARVTGYDEHMINDVGGCAAGYRKMAEVLASRVKDGGRLLDLGCGTGLELDEIWRLLPNISVRGIDMTQAMLDELTKKHPDKKTELVCGNYFDVEFGTGFDAAVSFQTMHHFMPEEKLSLYRRIYDALSETAVYIECDYMCQTDEQEEYFRAELARMKKEQGLSEGLYHYDIPCTYVHQLELLFKAGFNNCVKVFQEENTIMIMAIKRPRVDYVKKGLEPMAMSLT